MNYPEGMEPNAVDRNQASAPAEDVEREELKRWLQAHVNGLRLTLAEHLPSYNTLEPSDVLENFDAYMEDFVERVMEGV